MNIKLSMTILLLLIICKSYGQQDSKTQKLINYKHLGGFSEIGIPLYDLPEGNRYVPLLFGLSYNLPLWQTKKKFNISTEIKPQFGYLLSTQKNIELGINVMFNFNFLVSRNSYLSYKMSSGPHYINIETDKQAKGFIFSDNFQLGYYHHLKLSEKHYSLGVVGGFRHISNASIKQPNNGIDNWMIGISLAMLFN